MPPLPINCGLCRLYPRVFAVSQLPPAPGSLGAGRLSPGTHWVLTASLSLRELAAFRCRFCYLTWNGQLRPSKRRVLAASPAPREPATYPLCSQGSASPTPGALIASCCGLHGWQVPGSLSRGPRPASVPSNFFHP